MAAFHNPQKPDVIFFTETAKTKTHSLAPIRFSGKTSQNSGNTD